MKTSTTRFSDRVDDYIKFRPHYPSQIIEGLKRKIGFSKEDIVADIGSGTGISSEIFIDNGNKVFAVEPNTEMRQAAEITFSEKPNFISVNGTAENSNLESNSIDLIFCGQAFHWFNKQVSKLEFSRILRANGNIVLAWNVRNEENEFQKEYEQILISNIAEHKDVTHKNISDQTIADFFEPKVALFDSIINLQEFDLEGLKGRLKSSSYCPKEGTEHDRLFKEIESLFKKFEHNGIVKFEYQTKIYYC
ncbi:MAG TPA: class I SAM-dependent methyltransferase [Hanamia sp.]